MRNELSLPVRFRDKTLLGFKGYEDKVGIAKNSISEGKSLFLYGPNGTGKTHLAVGLLYDWFVRGIKYGHDWLSEKQEKIYPKIPMFIPSVEFFLELKSSFDSKVSELEIIDKYSHGLLLLDDLGAEKVSDWSRQVCYTLIDRRYREMQPTIITSNLGLNELAKTIDERIASRIVEMGAVVKLEGKDYRLGLSETSR